MTWEINEQTLGIWYVQIGTSDWMASVWLKDDGTAEGGYRWRHYRDDKAFDSKDEKNWYTLKQKSAEPVDPLVLIESVSEMARFIEKMEPNTKRYELIRGSGSAEWFMEEFLKLPFVHAMAGAMGDARVTDWLCLRCGMHNESQRVSCVKCHALRSIAKRRPS